MTVSLDPQTVSTENITNELMADVGVVNLIEEVETVIGSMAVDQKVMVGHSEEGYLWKFNYGSVEVFVQITGLSDDDTLTVWSFILALPAQNENDLFKKILTMNWRVTMEARFGILDDNIVVVSSRSVADLSPGELSRTITIVATLADDNDEALQAEYGIK